MLVGIDGDCLVGSDSCGGGRCIRDCYGPFERKDPKRSGQDALTGEDNSRTLTAFSENGSQRGLLPSPQRRACRTTTAPSANYNYFFSVQVPKKNKIKVLPNHLWYVTCARTRRVQGAMCDGPSFQSINDL